MLVLHIGLVKTGTTFLQYRIFRPAPGLLFVHRKRGRRALELTSTMRAYTQSSGDAARPQRRRIVRLLNMWRDAEKPLLVTDENVGLGPRLFWAGKTARPEKVARRLARLRENLAPGLLPLRIVLGLRQQDQWLGSSYAEYSASHPEFSQADFDSRMRGIAGSDPDDPTLGWLDFHAAYTALRAALGPENVLVVPLERLTAAPDETLSDLARFLGGSDVLGPVDIDTTVSRPSNKLSSGSDSWRLRRDESLLTLAPELRDELRARFAASNRALAKEIPLGFAPETAA